MYQVEILQTHGVRQGFYVSGKTQVLPALGYNVQIFDDSGLVLKTGLVLETEEHACSIFFKTSNSSYLLRILEYIQAS